MHLRAFLPMSMIAAAAVLGIGAGDASAATLFTSSAHTTLVAPGTKVTFTSATPHKLTSATGTINTCAQWLLNADLTVNLRGKLRITVTATAFTSCAPLTESGVFTIPWSITIPGTGVVSGTGTDFGASVDDVALHLGVSTYTGNLTTGVTASEPTTGTSPVCLDLDNAGTVVAPMMGPARFDGSACMTGASATWSLGD